MNKEQTPAGLLALLDDLELYRYVDWQSYDADSRQGPTDDLMHLAACASSVIRNNSDDDQIIMLDIDTEAYLVPSSTPGHNHLYINVTVGWEKLERLLVLLAECNIIEPGYAGASISRKSTTLRLPWIQKGHEPDHGVDEQREQEGLPMLEAGESLMKPYVPVDAEGNRMLHVTVAQIRRGGERKWGIVPVRWTPQRETAWEFINAHEGLCITAEVLNDPGRSVSTSIEHDTYGDYVQEFSANPHKGGPPGEHGVMQVLDQFTIGNYLAWVHARRMMEGAE